MPSVAVTVCRMDAAFECTGMGLQRVTATDGNSSLGQPIEVIFLGSYIPGKSYSQVP
ncbi:MAG: hypothetical protein RQ982_00295 [Gammaproteobacteria bacterium]|nr:hypothetical protein [Gammaproteobacteria bacterium]